MANTTTTTVLLARLASQAITVRPEQSMTRPPVLTALMTMEVATLAARHALKASLALQILPLTVQVTNIRPWETALATVVRLVSTA